uniref:Uncharacterized protein n=1 Tax=Anguilla anguilla TaxID=7936 RepID=A0A0E9TV45_ANGAN
MGLQAGLPLTKAAEWLRSDRPF